ncbi:MAG: NUDIX domain-containing protein [Syntrophothermus sp.]
MEPGIFNIRVYGLLIDEERILVTDEFRLGMRMTKFPGGGLIYGEGIADCLKREFLEELNSEIIRFDHYYTTEQFFETRLLPYDSQLINVYYRVQIKKPYPFLTTTKPFDFPEEVEGAQCFRWVKMQDLDASSFTFPIDRFLAEKLKNEYHV